MKDFDKDEKWQDLGVTARPIIEHFQERVQMDGYIELESQIDVFMCVRIVQLGCIRG